MELQGKISVIGETQEVGSNGFKKRQLVIKTDEQYVQTIGIDFVQDKTEILNKYNVGQDVKVGVNIRGNEYNGKYYVSLQGWRIEALESNTPTIEDATKMVDQTFEPEDKDDLPF